MRFPDSWSFRQKPSGAFKHLLRIPVYVFRWRLGFVLGERIVLISHTGRRSGRSYQSPVEVVEHDRTTHEYIVCSGTGPDADWYRNLKADPATLIQVGNRRWTPTQRFLDPDEAAQRFRHYEAEHPGASRQLLDMMGNSYDGTDEGRRSMMDRMPMIAFTDA
ncbi:MAG TPA: nitroreductase family deazaflavin-dependent oxidoreductase [Acidimicrobiales bacterium]|nr:nitroreductase family deazaflavin-dependent oxidoreductase [Acidimicrobiales bacterium]